jgi:hypothetical protein
MALCDRQTCQKQTDSSRHRDSFVDYHIASISVFRAKPDTSYFSA